MISFRTGLAGGKHLLLVSRRTEVQRGRKGARAENLDVLRLVMEGLVLVGIGAVIGLAMGVAVEQLLNSTLFNAGGVDLTVYAVVVPALILATMLAAFVPARRASRIPPTMALRWE